MTAETQIQMTTQLCKLNLSSWHTNASVLQELLVHDSVITSKMHFCHVPLGTLVF